MKYEEWDVVIIKAQYGNGRIALMLKESTTGEAIATCTVNLPNSPMGENITAIKNYSENKGMLEWLVKEGIVRDTGNYVSSGFINAPLVEVLI
jgi:hypothetical protein